MKQRSPEFKVRTMLIPLVAVGLALTPGCVESSGVTPTPTLIWHGDPNLLSPAAKATEAAVLCATGKLDPSVSLYGDCSQPKTSAEISEIDKIKAVINSDAVDPKLREMYLQTLRVEKEMDGKKLIDFYEYYINGSSGHSSFGCVHQPKYIPFVSMMIFPKFRNNDPENSQDSALATRWHEPEHLRRALERYKAGVKCPYLGSKEEEQKEEFELGYWGFYLQAAARRAGIDYARTNGVSSEQNHDGIDMAEVVYQVLYKDGIDFNSELYKFLADAKLLSQRYRYVSDPEWQKSLNNEAEKNTTYVIEIKSLLASVESNWRSVYSNLSPKEKQAVQEMIDKGLVMPKFFPKTQ